MLQLPGAPVSNCSMTGGLLVNETATQSGEGRMSPMMMSQPSGAVVLAMKQQRLRRSFCGLGDGHVNRHK